MSKTANKNKSICKLPIKYQYL